MEDQRIIELYFTRDERAIAETAKSYGKDCMQVSMNILHSHPDAEECVNDTYLRAWNTIPPTRPNVLRAFLCKITRNLSLNRLRDMHRMGRDAELTVSLTELEGCLALPEENGEELAELLSDFLKAQDKEDRLLFMGRYWHGISVADLAARMGMKPNTVTVKLKRTRERLRDYLSERGYSV
jgi:RNA polymerase sigma-70 factor (ECF subfamily)